MSPEWLQSLFAAITLAGLAMMTLGGAGYVYFDRKSSQASGEKIAAELGKLNERVASLQTRNEELSRSLAPPPVAHSAPPEVEKKPPAKKLHLSQREHSAVKPVRPVAALPAVVPPAILNAETLPAPVAEKAGPQENGLHRINMHQRRKLETILGKHTNRTMTISSIAGNEEGLEFAESLRQVFKDSGWRVEKIRQILSVQKPPVGLCLSTATFPSPPELVATYEALSAAGFRVSQQLDSHLKDGQTELIVGLQEQRQH